MLSSIKRGLKPGKKRQSRKEERWVEQAF